MNKFFGVAAVVCLVLCSGWIADRYFVADKKQCTMTVRRVGFDSAINMPFCEASLPYIGVIGPTHKIYLLPAQAPLAQVGTDVLVDTSCFSDGG